MAKYLLPSARADQQPEPQGQQLMDASQARAMLAYQQQMMQIQMQEQLMAQEMAMYQQQQAMQAQHQAQLQQMYQQQMMQQQQQYHAAHLDANDIRKVMGSLRPGESFEVELYQGFEVRHSKQRMNGAQIVAALVLAVIIIGLAVSS